MLVYFVYWNQHVYVCKVFPHLHHQHVNFLAFIYLKATLYSFFL